MPKAHGPVSDTNVQSEGGVFDPLREGVLHWRSDQMLVRFMFASGSTIDVLCEQDDSHMRGALLKHCDEEQIVGSTVLERVVQ